MAYVGMNDKVKSLEKGEKDVVLKETDMKE